MQAVTNSPSQSQPRKRAVIVGLGTTGLSCARFLSARDDYELLAVDSRETPPGVDILRSEMPNVALKTGAIDVADLKQADLIVLSPGVALRTPAVAEAVASGVEVVGDIELFARVVNAPVVAITGSNGKSTVTTMLDEIARVAGLDARAGGNLGTPALDLLDPEAPDFYILELSSFQLETTHSLTAEAATVLNISADHMDRYDNIEDYAAAKAKVYLGAAHRIVNLDDPRVVAMAGNAHLIGFTLAEPAEGQYGLREFENELWLAKGEQLLLRASELQVAGRHNLANALAAMALAEAMDIPPAAVRAGLMSYGGLVHRCQLVAEHKGVRWYDDSKGTNVGATVAALEGLPGMAVLIAGGQAKNQDFLPLRETLAKHARAVVLLGEDAALIEQAIDAVVPVVRVGDMRQAVAKAATLAMVGDAVLLSPACASFDMFHDYHQRGLAFVAAVEEVTGHER